MSSSAPRAAGLVVGDALRAGRLERHLADAVRERVVHADRQPRAFLGDRRSRRVLAGGAQRAGTGIELGDQVGAAPQQLPDDRGRAEEEGEEHEVVERWVLHARGDLVGERARSDGDRRAGRGASA